MNKAKTKTEQKQQDQEVDGEKKEESRRERRRKMKEKEENESKDIAWIFWEKNQKNNYFLKKIWPKVRMNVQRVCYNWMEIVM